MNSAKSRVYGIMAMAAILGGGYGSGFINPVDVPPVDLEEQKRKYKDVLLKKGVKEFDFDGVKILARSYNNALKKYRNVQQIK